MFQSLCALACLVLTTAPRDAAAEERASSPRKTATTVSSAAHFEHPILTAHNAERMRHRLPPLQWDRRLAAAAHRHARRLAASGELRHGDLQKGREHHGENLWAGTRDAYDIREMVDHWVAERRNFVNRPIPYASRTGSAGDVGHYTQIIWQGTRSVGCAKVAGAGEDYLVCRYAPGGNVMGMRAVP